MDFPGGAVVKKLPANAGDADAGSFPGLGRSPGEGHGNPLHYSCLENPMDRRAWQAKVHGVTKSRTAMLLSPPGKKTEWGLGMGITFIIVC